MVFALQFRRDDELFDIILAQRVAELRIAKLGRADSLLLLFDPATALQGQPNRPFQVFVGNRLVRAGMNQFEQTANGLRYGILVSAAECPAESHPPLKGRGPAMASQPAPAFAKEVAYQAEMVRS